MFLYDSVWSIFSILPGLLFSHIFLVETYSYLHLKKLDAIISPGLNVKRFLPSQNLVQSYTYFFTVQRI